MNNFANVLLTSMLSWVRTAVQEIWSLVSGEQSGLLNWVADNWLALIILLCAAGMVIDLIVYMFRWRPYLVWASFFRRMRRRAERKEDGLQGRRVRRWVYADGRARTEHVDEDDEADAPMVMVPLPVMTQMGATEGSEAAAPADAGSLPDQSAARLRYRDELEERRRLEQEQAVIVPPVQRNRRAARHAAAQSGMANRLTKLLASPEDEEQLPRYVAAKPAGDHREAFDKPYIPPQWKRPDETA